MPALEDFPVVGQRDYRAKSAGGAPARTAPPPPPAAAKAKDDRRKVSLLDRLTGRNRPPHTQGDSRVAPREELPAQDSHPNNSGASTRDAPVPSQAAPAPSHEQSDQARPVRSGQDAEMAMFFGKARK